LPSKKPPPFLNLQNKLPADILKNIEISGEINTYGLIGAKLSHSFSAKYFYDKFEKEYIRNVVYRMFQMDNLKGFRSFIINHPSIRGLNVTIPYKTAIIPYLDMLDEVAKETGAVNTIKVSRTNNEIHLSGYNTDVWGFERSVNDFEKYQHALVLGSGGAARAVCYVLKKRKINFMVVSRVPQAEDQIGYDKLNEAVLKKFLWIINATPLGMSPETDGLPPVAYKHLTGRHFLYDLIYNPDETRFLKEGKKHGAQTMNGLSMLKLQAEKSWEIWTTG
jgi:shikimate dehydrogenase